MVSNAKILKKLYLGFGAIIFILLFLVAAAFASFRKTGEANAWRVRSYQILVATQALREDIVSMDLAARSFGLSGEIEFLPALFQEQKEFLYHWNQTRLLTADSPAQQQCLQKLRENYRKWVAVYFEPLQQKSRDSRTGRVDPEVVLRISQQGKPHTEAMYRLVQQLNDASEGELQRRARDAARFQTLNQVILVCGGAFATMIAIGLSILLTRNTRTLAATNRDLEIEIAERRQAEVSLHRAKDAAESADRAKSEFLANMSHELRTPLNAIIGFSEILVDKTFGELNPRQEKYAANILSSGRHLLHVINEILDLSKVEAGHVQLELAPLNVASAIGDVVAIVSPLAARKDLDLNVAVESDLPVLLADESKFKQILYNLLSNAIKFTPAKGNVRLTAQAADGAAKSDGIQNDAIQKDSVESGQVIRVAVSDSGIGIKPQDQARIFGKFEQIDSVYGREQQGTGLGLALAQCFVELHGGSIRVESDGSAGRGTTFTFELPVKTAEKAAAPPDSEGSPPPDSAGGSASRQENSSQEVFIQSDSLKNDSTNSRFIGDNQRPAMLLVKDEHPERVARERATRTGDSSPKSFL